MNGDGEYDATASDDEASTGGSHVAGHGPSSDVLRLDHLYEALGHPRRRYLCYTLLEETDWTLDDLARKVAAREYGVPDHDVTAHQHQEVYVSLYHAHVPKLVAEGVVTFDEATISAAENAEQVLTALAGMGASIDANQEIHARSALNGSPE